MGARSGAAALLLVAFCCSLLAASASASFVESFDGDWESRWKHSGEYMR
jgi:hypothetical protein